MKPTLTRRSFLGSSLAAGALMRSAGNANAGEERRALEHKLDEVAAAPVLRVDGLDKPVKIASMELLRNGRNFVVRVRTTDGAEGIGVPNAMHLIHTYPIFLNRVAPFFVGKDARQLEPLLWELYRHNDNYKYQGLALWVCVAAAEFAILDLLGKLTGPVDRRPAGRGQTARDRRLPGQRRPRQHARGGSRLSQAARRRDRSEGPQVSSRRPDEQERRLACRAGPRSSSRWSARRSARR